MPRMKIRRQQPAKKHFSSRSQAAAHYGQTTQPAPAQPAPGTPPAAPPAKRYNVHVSTRPPHLPDFTGTPGIVVLAGGTLWMAVTWNDFWKPYFDSWANGAALKTNLDGRLVIGGIVFLIMLAIMAEISPEAGGIMILIVLAMWLVFIVKGSGSGQLNSFFGWFNMPSTAQQQQKNPAPTQVPNVGGPGATLK